MHSKTLLATIGFMTLLSLGLANPAPGSTFKAQECSITGCGTRHTVSNIQRDTSITERSFEQWARENQDRDFHQPSRRDVYDIEPSLPLSKRSLFEEESEDASLTRRDEEESHLEGRNMKIQECGKTGCWAAPQNKRDLSLDTRASRLSARDCGPAGCLSTRGKARLLARRMAKYYIKTRAERQTQE